MTVAALHAYGGGAGGHSRGAARRVLELLDWRAHRPPGHVAPCDGRSPRVRSARHRRRDDTTSSPSTRRIVSSIAAIRASRAAAIAAGHRSCHYGSCNPGPRRARNRRREMARQMAINRFPGRERATGSCPRPHDTSLAAGRIHIAKILGAGIFGKRSDADLRRAGTGTSPSRIPCSTASRWLNS